LKFLTRIAKRGLAEILQGAEMPLQGRTECGLFRLWIIISALWVISCSGALIFLEPVKNSHVSPPTECARAANANECAQLLFRAGKDTFEAFGKIENESIYGPNASEYSYARFALLVLAPPVVTLIFGVILASAFRSFRSRRV
jgi:hypothetical protein